MPPEEGLPVVRYIDRNAFGAKGVLTQAPACSGEIDLSDCMKCMDVHKSCKNQRPRGASTNHVPAFTAGDHCFVSSDFMLASK